VLILNWRDTDHPEGGGAERYMENLARGLAAAGDHVTILCADHGRAPRDEWRDGVRYRRRGGRWTVYPRALACLATHPADVVIDVQNGVPFFSPLVADCPVVVLVHHVHREVWPLAVGPAAARLGWWLESEVAPWLYRRRRYVAVSSVTERELVGLGVAASRISVVRNGIDVPPVRATPATHPLICVVGRLVPHKRVDHAVEVLARLLPRWPDLRLAVIGQGYAADAIRRHATALGVADAVDLLGFVDETTKHQVLGSAWVHLCPSVKEGWGLVVMEAAAHGVPTVAYRAAGGLAESVIDGRTGLLADSLDELTAAVARLIEDPSTRRTLGRAARQRSHAFTWGATVAAFNEVLAAAGVPRPTHAPGTTPIAAVSATTEAIDEPEASPGTQ
jgi:glycosyltransferase involved in cell wall biosynthesis